LLRGESVAVNRRPLDWTDLAHIADAAQRLRVLDDLLIGQLARLKEAPPRRFVLSVVPLEKLGQEPSALLLGRAALGGNVGGQAPLRGESPDLELGDVLVGFLHLHRRPRYRGS